MRSDIKARWVTALRSGEYQQGRANLYTSDSGGNHFCCLGVLCDLAAKDGVVTWNTPEITDGRAYGIEEPDITIHGINDEFKQLPAEVAKWAGFDGATYLDWQPKVLLPGRPLLLPLYNVNDGVAFACSPHTFSQIADLIEQQL